MQRYIVIGSSVGFISGILELTYEQAASRRDALIDLGEDLFEITSPVQFKRGEELGYDGEVNKQLLQSLEEIAESDAAKKKLIDQQAVAAQEEKSKLLALIAQAPDLLGLENLIRKDETDEEILSAAEARAVELEKTE